jgi:hypothetical protein
LRYQQTLQVQLQERYRRLAKTGFDVYAREAGYLRQFIRRTPPLKAIVDTVERSLPELDPEAWIRENFSWQGYDWPETELGRAKVVWWLLNNWAEGGDPRTIAHSLSNESNFTDALAEMTAAAVEPFVEYLQNELGAESDVLYLLDRYRRRVEWFEQSALYDACMADTRTCEAKYDRDFRRFLFEQGIDYPFSQPASASGRADVVSGLETDDPLVCDVKIYDGDSRAIGYISEGVQQVLQYALDYGKTAAHLVIINLTDKDLELPSDGVTGEWPPRLEIAGVTAFLVAVRGKPRASASQQGRARPIRVSRDQLVGTSTLPASSERHDIA